MFNEILLVLLSLLCGVLSAKGLSLLDKVAELELKIKDLTYTPIAEKMAQSTPPQEKECEWKTKDNQTFIAKCSGMDWIFFHNEDSIPPNGRYNYCPTCGLPIKVKED